MLVETNISSVKTSPFLYKVEYNESHQHDTLWDTLLDDHRPQIYTFHAPSDFLRESHTDTANRDRDSPVDSLCGMGTRLHCIGIQLVWAIKNIGIQKFISNWIPTNQYNVLHTSEYTTSRPCSPSNNLWTRWSIATHTFAALGHPRMERLEIETLWTWFEPYLKWYKVNWLFNPWKLDTLLKRLKY